MPWLHMTQHEGFVTCEHAQAHARTRVYSYSCSWDLLKISEFQKDGSWLPQAVLQGLAGGSLTPATEAANLLLEEEQVVAKVVVYLASPPVIH